MKRRITLYFMMIILLTLGLVMTIFWMGLRQYYYHGIANTFQAYSEVVDPVWSNKVDYNGTELSTYSDEIIREYQYKDAELSLLNKKGELIQSSTGFYGEVKYRIDPFIYRYKTVYHIEDNTITGEKILAYYTPLIYGDQVIGILRYSTSLTNVNKLIRNLVGYGLIICMVVAGIVFFISIYLGNSIVRPLKDIVGFTQKMAEGKYKDRIEKNYPYEWGELASRLNYMGDEILKADRLKNDFISSISHELRTPLTGIKGWIEILRNPDEITKEEYQFGVSIIDSESERLISLVENLLDFSKYQSDRMNLNFSNVKVDDLIREVVFQFRKKAEEKDIQLNLETFQIVIQADANKLKQVLINIIDNAIKFSNKNEVIKVIQTINEEEVMITITDQGIGIAADNLDYIMNSFYKIDSKSIGSGLGLAISKNIIEMHQGSIQIQSDLGKGTSVTITLPLSVHK